MEVARKSQMILRNNNQILPLNPQQRILVIEQRIPYEFVGKDPYHHTHMFCEAMVHYNQNLILVDTAFSAFEDEIEECLRLAQEAELVVMTNYYARIVKTGNNKLLVKKLKKAGHKIVVVTNYPYIEGTTAEADAVICHFSATPDSIRASVELLFGKIQPCPTTRLPITLGPQEEIPEKKLKVYKKNPFAMGGS